MNARGGQKKRILLLAPSYGFIYKGSMIKPGAMYSPHLGLATIAGALTTDGHSVRIVDLNKQTDETLLSELKDFKPHYAGLSFTTILAEESFRLARLVKNADGGVLLIAGGVHPTSMPLDVLESSVFDLVCQGEGDESVVEIVRGTPLEEIPGIAFKRGGKCHVAPRRQLIRDLDSLAYPAWELFDLSRYHTTELLTKANPAGWIETSRGCPYGCVYCNKNVFGKSFRKKSAARVVAEMSRMLDLGFKEIHIADDCFTVDLDRAKEICREILRKNLRFPWATVTGIRADRVDQELLTLMKQAGCYRVFYGIETGSAEILKLINKGETLGEIRQAVTMAKKAGLEVYGFFMLALPGDTEKTMQETIEFARELDLDMAKAAITIPLPSTPYFEELDRAGRIKKKEWSKYNLYFPARDLYTHPNLDWAVVEKYQRKFYRGFYFRPGFIFKRFLSSLRGGRLLNDLRSFLQIKW
ncbi:MAG: radical SAM protein [Elusimicrobiales bacterium]